MQRYFSDHDAIELSSVLRALRDLILGDDDDEALSRRLFSEFGSYDNPRGVGVSTRAWLQTLTNDFEREIKARE